MEKVLSIIIPTYNMEKYLDKCLNSLIIEDKELMSLLEILVVIDGAKDRSSEIAHSYQKLFPYTICVIDKENGNYGSCINRGLSEATGKYVKILDADDHFDTKNFEVFLKNLKEQNNDLIVTDFEYVNERYETTGLKKRTLPTKTSLKFSEVVSDFNGNLISMHELTYRLSIFKEIYYHQTEGISYTDLEWCFLPMSKVNTVIYFDLVVYKYLIGREGQTVSPKVAMRTLSHKMKSGIVMAKQYQSLKGLDDFHILYMERRISWSLAAIYYNYLVSYRKQLSLDELISFDSELQTEAPSVYKLLNKEVLSHILPIHYIKKWRKQQNMLDTPLSIKIYIKTLLMYRKIKQTTTNG